MKRFFKAAVFGFLGLMLCHCGDDDAASSGTTETFNGKGSTWQITFQPAGTFSGTESESGATVSGTWTDNSTTGFRVLTVTASSGSTAPAVDTVIGGIYLPGIALFLAPILSDETTPVVLALEGDCPTATAELNWIQAQVASDRDMTSASRDGLGAFTITATAATQSAPSVGVDSGYSIAASTPGSNIMSGDQTFTGTCTNGVLSVSSGDGSGKIWMTEEGEVGLIAAGEGGTMLGIKAAELTQTKLAGQYAGFVFNSRLGTVSYMNSEFNAAGTSNTITVKSGPTATATDGDVYTQAVTAMNSPSNGFIWGTFADSDSNTGNKGCAVLENTGGTTRTTMLCIGQEPNNTTKGFVTLMIEKANSTTSLRRNFFVASFNWVKSILGFK